MDLIFKLTHWYFSKNALPYWAIFILDCAIVLFSMLTVYALNNGFSHTVHVFWPLVGTAAVYLCVFIAGFRIFRTYSGVIRYSSFVDLQRIGFAVVMAFVVIVLLDVSFGGKGFLVNFRIWELFISALFATMLMWAVRIVVKYLYDISYREKQAQRIFIYGVKQGGISLAKSVRNQEPSTYSLAGFVSDKEEVQSKMLLGVQVYPNDENLVDVMKRKGVGILMVSPLKSEALRENSKMVNRLTKNGIKIFMVPDAKEWDGKSELSHTQLKEVDIEDLLPRDKIEVDMEAIGRLLTGKSIMITGAAGSIGSEIVRQVAAFNPLKLVLVDQAETPLHDIRLMMKREWGGIDALTLVSDIKNAARMEDIFRTHRPDYVFHAAAYKHVPMMEDNPSESVQNNVDGTRVIADLAVKYGTKKFVMVSTDKAVNPTNVMGCSKRICEIYVQSLDKAIKEGKVQGSTQFVTTRFGNVLGSNGSVIPLFREQIRNGGPITVTHPDIIRFFMLIPEACKLVLEAGTMGKGGEIFVFDMGKPVKIVDLAKRMIYLSNAKDVEIKFTGLRDGEKLYEEVLNEEEITVPTNHPKIKVAKVRQYDYADVCKQIDDLVSNSFKEDDMQIVKRMKEIVPEFKSQHSKYTALD